MCAVGRGWGVCVWLAKWDGHVTRMSHGNGNDCVIPFSGDIIMGCLIMIIYEHE